MTVRIFANKDKQGNIIEHQDEGFDLTPLINALNQTAARRRCGNYQVGIDSRALATIGQVRTKDREQSLLNLSQPLNLQESPSHSL